MKTQVAQRLVDIAFAVSFEGDFTDLQKHLEAQEYTTRLEYEGTTAATLFANGRIGTAFMAYSDPITILSGMLIALWGMLAFQTEESQLAFKLMNEQWAERKDDWLAIQQKPKKSTSMANEQLELWSAL